ncbi:MAG: formimidoylglutamate deiminase [Deltaproteobacteria bacterium]|nr:formimidoylglutamate deiminase [Deltaproteobacteria bacterium]
MLSLSPDGAEIVLPALTTVHSHAFQRGMRGAAQRPRGAGGGGREDFWSWRGAMYRAASALDPESIERISRVAFRELACAGVRTVGEFHYIHHQPDGTPYDDRLVMSRAVVRAAKSEGLRISLLRVAYHRAGPGLPAEPGQRRFCDPTVDAVLRDIDDLRAEYKGDPDVRVGVAPHSVRAVPPEWIRELSAYATKHDLPFHMHVAEQQREIAECVAETGKRPVELLDHLGVLGPRFVAVHATHFDVNEAQLFGRAKAFACVCATTESDLGDGLPDLVAMRAAGARLCTGIDSHVITDPIADLRALETLARLRTQTRVTFAPATGTPAEALWRSGSIEGALACGFETEGRTLRIRRDHPSLSLVEDELLLDAIVFGGSSAMVASTSA